jgi:hypothetical protein
VVRPVNIANSHRDSFDRFESSQHLLTGHDIDLDGDVAGSRANLIAIHIWKDRPLDAPLLERSFTAGGVVTADLRRTPTGWQITRAEMRVIWRTGFFGNMLETK